MFSRSAYCFVLALPVLPSASVLPRDGASNQCNTGPLQCCNTIQTATPSAVSSLLGLLGIDVVVSASDVTGVIGLTCYPISVFGGSGNSCSTQPLCCTNNSFGGLIALGCTPATL